MNWIDYIILGILGLSVLIGLFRGLISELLGLIIWATAFWASWMFGPMVADSLARHLSMPTARLVIGYGAVLLGVLIIGAIIRAIIGRILWRTGLSGTDRMLGMVFGFARGALIVAFMVFMVSLTALVHEDWWRQSNLVPQFQGLAAWLGARVPAGVNHYVAQSGQLLDQVQVPQVELPKDFQLPKSLPNDWMDKLKQGSPSSTPPAAPSDPARLNPYPAQAAPATPSTAGANNDPLRVH